MTISPGDNLIDMRSVDERVLELEAILEIEARHEAKQLKDRLDNGEWVGEEDDEQPDPDEVEELLSLHELQDAYDGHDPVLIHEDHFVEYAQQKAEDIGAVEDAHRWPADHINWDEAADALKMDYSSLEWRDHTYYYQQ